MFVRILSDVHQEFGELTNVPEYPEDRKTVMILAGDVGLADKSHTYIPLLKEFNDRFAATLYILGNHEFYHSSLRRGYDKIKDNVEDEELDRVHVMENEVYTRYGVAFIGATLWTDFNRGDPHAMRACHYGLNDYNYIRTGTEENPYDRKTHPADMIPLHEASRKFIFKEIARQHKLGRRCVVFTHHLPSMSCTPKRFAGDQVNFAYASELGNQICDAEPRVWIHGHTHDSNDFMIHNTRIICNPRGYEGHELNPDFDIGLRIDV